MLNLIELIKRTYLIERLVGIGCYAFVMIITYNGIRSDNDGSVKKRLNICTIALVVLAFFFVPDEHKDLFRILEMTNGWNNYSLSEFYERHIVDAATSMGYFYYYLCRKIPFDGALPAITAAWFYSNVFHIIKLLQKKSKIKKEALGLSFLFFMVAGSFLEVISDIRNFLAFSILLRCFCDEWIDKKSILRSIPFYLFCALMHSAVIPLLFLRFLYYILFENDLHLMKKFLSVGTLGVMVGIFYVKYNYAITRSIEKATDFLNYKTYSYIWEYIIGIIQWTVICTLCYRISKNMDLLTSHPELVTINRMSIIILAIEAVLVFEYNIFHRFILVSLFLSIPQVAIYFSEVDDAKYKGNFKALCYLIFGIVCVRGNLCGYKFFILN